MPIRYKEPAAKAAASYLTSVEMTGIKAAPFHEIWAAAYQDQSTGVFARYMEGDGGVIRISTACYPGEYSEAEQVMGELTRKGVIHDPKFFDPNA